MDSTADQEVLDAALTLIHSRQHTSPKRLGDPGPDPGQIEKILSAAGAAPDHGLLTPWRLIIIPPERRQPLGEVARQIFSRDFHGFVCGGLAWFRRRNICCTASLRMF